MCVRLSVWEELWEEGKRRYVFRKTLKKKKRFFFVTHRDMQNERKASDFILRQNVRKNTWDESSRTQNEANFDFMIKFFGKMVVKTKKLVWITSTSASPSRFSRNKNWCPPFFPKIKTRSVPCSKSKIQIAEIFTFTHMNEAYYPFSIYKIRYIDVLASFSI